MNDDDLERKADQARLDWLDDEARTAERASLAAAWAAGHRDGCEDHMCEQMGHLSRNPYAKEGLLS